MIWVPWKNYDFHSIIKALEAIFKRFPTTPYSENVEKDIFVFSGNVGKHVGFWVSDLENGSRKVIFKVIIFKNEHI